jgi:hypothetical protein
MKLKSSRQETGILARLSPRFRDWLICHDSALFCSAIVAHSLKSSAPRPSFAPSEKVIWILIAADLVAAGHLSLHKMNALWCNGRQFPSPVHRAIISQLAERPHDLTSAALAH